MKLAPWVWIVAAFLAIWLGLKVTRVALILVLGLAAAVVFSPRLRAALGDWLRADPGNAPAAP